MGCLRGRSCRSAGRCGIGCRSSPSSARRCRGGRRPRMAEATTSGPAIETILLEERRYEPPADFVSQANAQPDIYDRNFEEFWETEGRERVSWFEPFQKLYEWEPPYAKWYIGGKLNICFNCVDRHVEAGNGDKIAYYWEGEP